MVYYDSHALMLNTISKRFRLKHNDQILIVLEDINYIFCNNKTYALTGPSGSGKSTIIYLLAGLDSPDAGSVLFNNQDINFLKAPQKENYLLHTIGLVFQQPHLIQELTVLENIMIKALINNHNKALDKKKAHKHAQECAYELLHKVNLVDKAHYNPALLSGGEQQRVAVARALFYKPHFLLADEPTAHLDVENSEIIINLLLDMHQHHAMGLIVATHDNSLANKLNISLEITAQKLLQKN